MIIHRFIQTKLYKCVKKTTKPPDGNWGKVFQITGGVRKNEKLKNDIKPDAVKIIYDYMDIYGEEGK